MSKVASAQVERVSGIKLILAYCLFATAWIIFSDRAVEAFLPDRAHAANVNIAKGLFFIVITAGLLHALLRRFTRKIDRAFAERVQALTLLQAIAESTDDAVFAKDLDGRYILLNRAARAALQNSVAEEPGQTDWDLFPEAPSLRVIESDQTVIGAGKSVTYDEDLMTLNGPRTFQTTKGPLRNAEGALIGVYGVSRDITEAKKVTESIRELNSRLAATLQAIPDLLFEMDENGVYRDVWARNLDLLYEQRDTLFGKKVEDVLPRAASEGVMSAIAEANETGGSYGTIIQLDLAGETRWFELSVAKKEGIIDGRARFIVLSRDITKRIVAQAEVASINAKLEAALASMTDAIFISDTEGRFVHFNEAFVTFHRFKGRFECYKSLDQYPDIIEVTDMAGAILPFSQWAVPRALRGETAANIEVKLRRKDTGESWIGSYSFAPIRSADGTITGCVVAGRDVTAQKNYDEVLRRESEKNVAFLRNASDGIHIVNTSGQLIEASDSFCTMLGYSREELIGQYLPLWDHQWRQGDIATFIKEHLRSAGRYQFEAVHTRKDGTTFDVEISGQGMILGGDLVLFNSSRDISERKLAEGKIAVYIKQVEGMMRGTLQVVANAVEKRDPYTAGHERRVGRIAADIARELGWTEERCSSLELMGLVHDIGKIGIPSDILTKPSKLSPIEYQLVQQHAELGYEILATADFPMPIAEIIRQHHEHMDGSGYPHGLRGDSIYMEARILAVADVLESMASHRPYRPSLGVEAAIDEITKHAGSWYDQSVVAAALRLLNEKGYHLPK